MTMVMPVLAEAQDVRDAWLLDVEDLPGEEALTRLVGRATRRLLGLDRRLASRLATDPDLASTARDVVVDMVLRVVSNPERIRTSSETTGPLTRSVTFGGDDPGGLYISDEEMRALGIRRRRQQVFSAPGRPRGWAPPWTG
ncbi:hypothetical protein D5R93_05735 [Actinomyces lilanjuaniae]|uniref:Phage protein Gp19/Gp15/Gp42 n=1 Tax=Actinomyces lilanjuaniae TaxID=2321394 RepID=A0ABM6Z354_9ACTO|nr:Gp19/Gp15/Gp42 family protein [Actinomyces lilanjuaniae]AYD89673.1 hypothetical protein D5R93_05735 [Actinomyces lilanjuaniae]